MDRDKSLHFHATPAARVLLFLFHFTSKIILCYNVVCISELIAIIEWRSSPLHAHSLMRPCLEMTSTFSLFVVVEEEDDDVHIIHIRRLLLLFSSCIQHHHPHTGCFLEMHSFLCVHMCICVDRRRPLPLSVCLFKMNAMEFWSLLCWRWNEEDGSHFRHEFTFNAL